MPFKKYEAELQRNLKSGHATEPTYYPALKSLLESLDSSISVLQNPKKTEHGSPDFRLTRKRTIEFPVGWIEAKLPGEDLGKIARSDQLKRYYHLPNLILTDFLEFRWYTDGKERLSASLGALANEKCKFDAGGQAKVEELLRGFLAHKTPPAKDSRDLARRMAQLAHFIREAILIALEREAETGILHQQMDAFREALIPDLDPEQFADMYSQTIAYGLFAARCQPAATRQNFSRDSAARFIPKTNPFLQKMFYVIAGPDLPETILPYMDDLVALLRDTDIGAIMADFGKRTAKEDPVVHFYEDFLQAYDPELRELRGVYYTPEPVVSYIVRSIDYILKNQFSKPLGLADKDVFILDPACGTGTFLYYVIRHIYDTLCQHGQKGQWNSYVSEHLLKRIFGFELLMAPYAVAHLKLGLLLQELGYKFESDERLGVYLTNTLEEVAKKTDIFFAQWIADEANAANEIKDIEPIMVVLGNPPYSGHSANRSWVERQLEPGESYSVVVGGPTRGQQSVQIRKARKRMTVRKSTFIGHLIQDYYQVDGEPLGEKNPKWLQDDYVKFIRFAEWRINCTSYGVLGFITNNGYLDNPTFRGMRQHLMREFSDIHILDLHGNSKKKERAPDGSKDENVFDIQQGVAIQLAVRTVDFSGEAKVSHADLYGVRDVKYKQLSHSDITDTRWQPLSPRSPSYLFAPRDDGLASEYDKGRRVNDIFPMNSVGVVTARDDLTIAFTRGELWKRILDFLSLPIEDARQKYGLGKDVRDWKVEWAQRDLKEDGPRQSSIVPILYRPFDTRWTYYTGRSRGFLCMPRPEVMRCMLTRANVALLTTRQTRDKWDVLVTGSIAGHKSLSAYDITSAFPLYGRPSDEHLFALQPDGDDSNMILQFNYAYAALHANGYRARYGQFLASDFPRVPQTSDKKLFAVLAEKGAELISLHLMESPALSKFITKYEQPGDHEVKKVRYAESNPKAGIKSGRVYINDAQYFEGMSKEVWEFHIGGYQVCEKWLKDRKGRKLSSDDIDHYQKIVVALAETIRIMAEIDSIIPGWPLP